MFEKTKMKENFSTYSVVSELKVFIFDAIVPVNPCDAN
jgi:hypothetical protein